MASIRQLLTRIQRNSPLNRLIANELLIRRNYVKSLYEDAFIADTNYSSGPQIDSKLINGLIEFMINFMKK
jgi:hypothetical protein